MKISIPVSIKTPHFTPGERTNILTRWFIFGVGFPLLPIVAKVSAEWIDEGHPNWSGSNLFGDGELLVIATVISAAGIGDLIFDLRRSQRQSGFRDACAVAVALVCIVASVTLYALVTLKREELTPAQQTATNAVSIQQSNVESLEKQLAAKNIQLQQAQRAQITALNNYKNEVDGTGRSSEPGSGPLAEQLLAQYHQSVNYTNSVDRTVTELQGQVAQSRHALTASQLKANETLQGVSPGEDDRAAEASGWMFFFGLFAGLNCVFAGSARSRESSRGISKNLSPASPTKDATRVNSGAGSMNVTIAENGAMATETADSSTRHIQEVSNGGGSAVLLGLAQQEARDEPRGQASPTGDIP